jgi:hypothetical protein
MSMEDTKTDHAPTGRAGRVCPTPVAAKLRKVVVTRGTLGPWRRARHRGAHGLGPKQDAKSRTLSKKRRGLTSNLNHGRPDGPFVSQQSLASRLLRFPTTTRSVVQSRDRPQSPKEREGELSTLSPRLRLFYALVFWCSCHRWSRSVSTDAAAIASHKASVLSYQHHPHGAVTFRPAVSNWRGRIYVIPSWHFVKKTRPRPCRHGLLCRRFLHRANCQRRLDWRGQQEGGTHDGLITAAIL